MYQINCPFCKLRIPAEYIRKEIFRDIGKARSPQKTAAARKNGKEGGRPVSPGRRIALIAHYQPNLSEKEKEWRSSVGFHVSRREAIRALRENGSYTHYFTPGGRLVRL
jgi:hypothetical protein